MSMHRSHAPLFLEPRDAKVFRPRANSHPDRPRRRRRFRRFFMWLMRRPFLEG